MVPMFVLTTLTWSVFGVSSLELGPRMNITLMLILASAAVKVLVAKVNLGSLHVRIVF